MNWKNASSNPPREDCWVVATHLRNNKPFDPTIMVYTHRTKEYSAPNTKHTYKAAEMSDTIFYINLNEVKK